MALKDNLIEDLTTELEIVDVDFNASLLAIKVDSAIKKVVEKRKYPENYSQERIDKDLEKYYSNIRDIALYFYNKVGADFEDSYNSNGVSRSFVNESKLYKGILPIARL